MELCGSHRGSNSSLSTALSSVQLGGPTTRIRNIDTGDEKTLLVPKTNAVKVENTKSQQEILDVCFASHWLVHCTVYDTFLSYIYIVYIYTHVYTHIFVVRYVYIYI